MWRMILKGWSCWACILFLQSTFLGAQPDYEPLSWPGRVSAEAVEITVVEEVFKDRRFVYRSNHFEFVSTGRLTRNLVRDFAIIFEATYSAIMASPLGWDRMPPSQPMRVEIYGNQEDYELAGGIPNSAGTYRRDRHVCLVPVSSLGLVSSSTGFRSGGRINTTILVHEVTHQVLHQWPMPIWMNEGFALFMERVPYQNGTFSFISNDVKGQVAASKRIFDRYGMERPSALLGMTWREWNSRFEAGDGDALARNYYSAFAMTAYFLGLGDAEAAGRYRQYLQQLPITVAGPSRDAVLLEHSSGLDLDTRVFRALRSVGVAVRFGE